MKPLKPLIIENAPVLLYISELSELARVSWDTYKRAMNRNEAPRPKVTIGKRPRFDRDEVLAWLRGQWKPAPDRAVTATA